MPLVPLYTMEVLAGEDLGSGSSRYLSIVSSSYRHSQLRLRSWKAVRHPRRQNFLPIFRLQSVNGLMGHRAVKSGYGNIGSLVRIQESLELLYFFRIIFRPIFDIFIEINPAGSRLA